MLSRCQVCLYTCALTQGSLELRAFRKRSMQPFCRTVTPTSSLLADSRKRVIAVNILTSSMSGLDSSTETNKHGYCQDIIMSYSVIITCRNTLLTWLWVLEYRCQTAPHKAGPLCLHALHPGQWGGNGGLDALEGSWHGHGHQVVSSLNCSFPQHPRD